MWLKSWSQTVYHVKFSVSEFFPCDLDAGFKVSTNFIKTLVVKMTEKLLNIIKNQKQQICFIYDLCLNFWTVNFRLILRKFEFKIGKIVVPKFYFLGVLIFSIFLSQNDVRSILAFKLKFNIAKAQFTKALLACQTECWNRPNFKIYQWKISIIENIIIININHNINISIIIKTNFKDITTKKTSK